MILPTLPAARARQIIAQFADHTVLVAGDVMLDRFVVGDVTRISPEAPVPVVRFASEHVRLGGAANVAHNVRALGGRTVLVGVVGRDAAAGRLREALAAAGIPDLGLVEEATRRTTEKVRIVTRRGQQVARIDYELDEEIDGGCEAAVIAGLRDHGREAGTLVVSDYLKGTITRPIVEVLLALRNERHGSGAALPPVIVDPKIPHLACYRGASLITPNHHEAEAATHRQIRTDEDARDAARDLRERAGCEAALITRGEQGLWVSSREVEGAAPATAREVADVTGAGDTVVATLALALAAGATLAEAAALANIAAGVVVGKFGPSTVSGPEILGALSQTEALRS